MAVWSPEVNRTYLCFEHFMSSNGRGAGFHQFSGLSTPVLMWFESYYKPFTVSAGFRTLICEKEIEGKGLSFTAITDTPHASVIVCLKEGVEYVFDCDAEVSRINKAAYLLKFNAAGSFRVSAIEKK